MRGEFDAIILDAPRSGTGTISGHPELKWIRTEQEVRNRISIQSELIRSNFPLLKNKGILVYSVCSLEREEGEDIVLEFVSSTRGAKLIHPLTFTEPSLKERVSKFVVNDSYLRILPDKYLDGFFVALIERTN
ncbi:MAG: hypothetical protein MZV49_13240 [Rhodopseudomonas palustris]|nr:hypothetical protein [Rhodopseudomonas palustris]